jgi:hypothetical protein
MPDAPILPDLSVIGAGKDALVAVRPSAAAHVERGVWSHLFVGWRAQYGLARQGLAAEVNAARLPLSSSQALTELCQSNFDTSRGQAAKAVGELTLTRTVVHVRPDPAAAARLPTADAGDVPNASPIIAFNTAFYLAFSAHLVSVYSASTGLGSHALADPSSVPLPLAFNAGDLAFIANNWQLLWNRHLGDLAVSDGSPLAVHTDPDAVNVLTTPPAFASSPSLGYSAQTAASRASILTITNALRRVALAHLALEARSGTVRAGTRVSVVPDPRAVPPVPSSDHLVSADLYVPPGVKTVLPRTVAALAGTAGDLPAFASGPPPAVVVRDSLFDAGSPLPFAPASLASAGGTLGQSDPLLRNASSASWRGSWGPNVDALLAGVLTSVGAAHFAELDDHSTGTAYVYPSDEAWAQSSAWLELVSQALRRGEWSGVGQRVRFGRVLNVTVRVRLDVHLRDASLLTATDPIAAAVKAALLSYFDDRPDWYVFRTSAVGDAAAGADRRRILRVVNAVVTDADGVPVPDPAVPAGGDPVHHWRLDDNALDATFLPPGG